MEDLTHPHAGQDESCFAWLEGGHTEGQDRAALVRGARWTAGDIISIGFMDGDPGVQARVVKAAKEWIQPGLANLRFSFAANANTLIRVSFRYQGSWSVIGTTCKRVPKDQPTMNFGWLTPSSTDAELRRVVLHEFGHALGLIHEHQNPAGGIHWNKAQVYKDLSGPPNGWSRAAIDHNMFELYSRAETNFTAVDGRSIMMYPIPATWTTDGFHVGLNSTLSAMDRQFIRAQYPAPGGHG